MHRNQAVRRLRCKKLKRETHCEQENQNEAKIEEKGNGIVTRGENRGS